MNREDENKRKIARFPDDVREAYLHSSNHRREIESSSSCGCFYCTAVFPPKSIVEWVDENSTGIGQTALCPYCGIDSVIGDRSGFTITKEFLPKMRRHLF